MTTEPTGEQPLLYTIPQAAALLQCSRGHVYRFIDSGELETVKIGALRRIPADALATFLARLRAEKEAS